jgi:hypothetical protein
MYYRTAYLHVHLHIHSIFVRISHMTYKKKCRRHLKDHSAFLHTLTYPHIKYLFAKTTLGRVERVPPFIPIDGHK